MRFVIKVIFKLTVGFFAIAITFFSIAPATQGEKQLLGGNPERLELVQMRLANLMLDYAPEFAVSRMADATGIPAERIIKNLERTANGQSLTADGQSETGDRRFEAGGALFVSSN